MKYIYESTQPGVFNFTIPGEDKTVTLFKGSKVTVGQKLAGGYLRVLRFIKEVPEEETTKKAPAKKTTPNKAKVEDKITRVEEVEEVVETANDVVTVKADDTVKEVVETPEEKVQEKPAPKRIERKKRS